MIRQTVARIFRGDTQYPEKLASIFEPHTEIIRKGKASKPTEFGKMVPIQEAENQIVTVYEVFDKRPWDSDLLVPAVEAHRQQFDRAPRLVAADAAFYSKANEDKLHEMGVCRVAVPNRHTRNEERKRLQRRPWFKEGQRWRTGCEGRMRRRSRARSGMATSSSTCPRGTAMAKKNGSGKAEMSAAVRQTIRCAVYTRKSTDEGLQQEFNSLDAQREAGEAFILSQRHEGWQLVPTHYDDGGYSGGNMERPALKRLLVDIEARKVDCVLVYKVDRLSRSLMDFARIMESFDKRGVSFVSVTQQFNTTTSLGRLTLNILLSFAQFEREIISERTRDKQSAARQRASGSAATRCLDTILTRRAAV